MALKEFLKRLERQAVKGSDSKFCSHYPPEVHYPDGSSENVIREHDCGLPRLHITIRFTNRRDRLTVMKAREAIAEARRLFPDVTESKIVDSVMNAFGIPEEELL